jgi:hypothetical protein
MLTQSVANWLAGGQHLDSEHHQHETHPWHKVLWLTGVDYFSTLGYQPGIALLAAGALSPIATAILVLVTLLCALPIYGQVAQRSYAGQGSIAMLENLFSGWWGKLLVLVLIGFAATDFVITITLSAADAAQHAVENPILHPLLGEHRMEITIFLLMMLTLVFLKGFKEAIGLAALVAIPYILLNVIVLGRAASEVYAHPELISKWKGLLGTTGGTRDIMIAAVLIFPRLALGLSCDAAGVGGGHTCTRRQHQKAADSGGHFDECAVGYFELCDRGVNTRKRVQRGRSCQRKSHRLYGAQVFGVGLWNGIRCLHDSDSLVCRRKRYGWAAECYPSLFTPVWHGPIMGGAFKAAGVVVIRIMRGSYSNLQSERGGARRRLCYGCFGFDVVRCGGLCAGLVERPKRNFQHLLLDGGRCLPVYIGRKREGATGRHHHWKHFHFADSGGQCY